jgi:nicotinamidase-related amidase
MTVPEPLTPDDTTIVMIDYGIGFADLVRSHDTALHLNNVQGLAQTAVLFGTGLVVTNGVTDKPSGPLYPELLEIIGDHPVVIRAGATNAFADPGFAQAVKDAGNTRLAIGGISTEGCVLQSVLGALREGYDVNLVADACGSLSRETHDLAVQRMVLAGAVPTTMFSLAGELEWEHGSPRSAAYQQVMRDRQPSMTKGTELYLAGKEAGRKAAEDAAQAGAAT